jgi:hypothetical protein
MENFREAGARWVRGYGAFGGSPAVYALASSDQAAALSLRPTQTNGRSFWPQLSFLQQQSALAWQVNRGASPPAPPPNEMPPVDVALLQQQCMPNALHFEISDWGCAV